MKLLYLMAERGIMPDALIRLGVRRLNRKRMKDEEPGSLEIAMDEKMKFVATMRESPVAIATKSANEQHYELPPEFFQKILGKWLKYSACYWPPGATELDDAEEAMLSLTCERAGLEDGMRILDLGCGWGSLSFWIADKFPRSNLVAVSNSRLQGAFIRSKAQSIGLGNLQVQTADMNSFHADGQFDRVLSIEMFEHMRNWHQLFQRVAEWLKDEGKFFMHVFVHRANPYLFQTGEKDDWMARYFFTGGMMPSSDLPLYFQESIIIDHQWLVNGSHYRKTAEAWLQRLDRQKSEIINLLGKVYGDSQAALWLQRWRIFFMACAELFATRGGDEWLVAHYLMSKKF